MDETPRPVSTALEPVQVLDELKLGFQAALSHYQTPRVVLIEYDEKKQWLFPETFLGTLYFRLKEDGTLPIIFPGMDMSHVNRFIAYMSKAKGFVVCCEKTPDGVPKPVGLGWLPECNSVHASFGFGFFKFYWRKREHVDLSFLMLQYWLEAFKLSVLYGTTLNPIAHNYSKRFGFKSIGVLPKFFVCNGEGKDAHLISLEKPDFLRYHAAWKVERG